jgi:hypothetical protein
MYNLDAPPKALLTTGNPKVAKGEKLGYLTAILHFAPARMSAVADVCSHRTTVCTDVCLVTSGRGGIGAGILPTVPTEADLQAWLANMPRPTATVHAARIRRTRFFKRDRAAFMRQLVEEIHAHIRRAARHGLKPAVRLNGTSDLPWENIRTDCFANVFEAFPQVTFYDYTKVPARLRRRALGIPNYSLTFSLAESNEEHARDALAAGFNVAAVFAVKRGQPLPAEFWGHRVIDGDLSDLRFTDPSGVIVGLRAKGRAINDTSGFVRQVKPLPGRAPVAA